MPPVDHGRFTLNVDLSVVRRDNSARYDRVALDEWDTRSGEHVRTIDVQLAEPMHGSDLLHLIAGLNSGRIPARFAD